MSRIFDRATLLAKVETTYNVDAAPSASTDALLVGNPEFNFDITQLERNIVRSDMSPLATVAGRKVARLSFTHEVRNNGNAVGTLPPRIAALLKACGFSQTQITGAAGTIGTAAADPGNTGTISFAKTVAYAGYVPRVATIEATTGGGTGVAVVTVSAPAQGEIAAYSVTGIVVTNATPIALPNGATVTPTIGTSLDVGDTWTIALTPAGYEFEPVSDDMDSATLHLNRDGVLHKMTGCRGSFSIQGTGGQYAQFNFTFTGSYVQPEDDAMPDPTYETTKPVQVELAQLTVGAYGEFAAAEFSMDMANDVQIREDINAANAYAGAVIVGRKPTFTMNPEAILEADHPVWANLASGAELVAGLKVGTVKGNVVAIDLPNMQYTNVQYGNRNNILTYDITCNLARVTGNDEVKISFR